jgi:glycosyltransferase involved in cell wall biosynthesis
MISPEQTVVDVVVAVRSEERTLSRFIEEVEALSLPQSVSLRVLFVEDSSTDGTVEVLRRLAQTHQWVSYWKLEKGYGQVPPILFGLTRSTGDAVVMMDVDGGHPVSVLSEMIGRFLEGAAIVQAVRRPFLARSLLRRLGAALYSFGVLVAAGVDLRRQNVYFRLLSRDFKAHFLANRRWSRFLRIGCPDDCRPPYALVYFDSAPRLAGESKYTLGRLVKSAVEGTLSLMSARRAAAWGLLLLAAAGVLLATPVWPLGVLLAAALAALARLYYVISTEDLVGRLRVVEAGGGPGVGLQSTGRKDDGMA